MTKIIRQDGRVTYYYYQKKKGRHKKVGRKRQKRKTGKEHQQTWDFKIIQCLFRKQDKYIGKYRTASEALKAKNKIEEINKTIIFPKKYINNGAKSDDLFEYINEYVILKRIKDEGDTNTQIRNEYGRFVDITTTSDEWVVYDKFPCLVEETFWVYGYNPQRDRKTFSWIKNALIDELQSNINYIRIQLYNNKVLIRYDNLDFNMVICKNTSDAIRMYNLFEKEYDKEKNILMLGMIRGYSDKTNKIVEEIHEKTGWDYKKIYRTSTRN